MIPEPIAATLQVIAVLDAIDAPYFIGGSMASAIYGEPRTKMAANIVADLKVEHVSALANLLGEEFYIDEKAAREAIAKRGSVNLIHYGTGFKVDVFIRKGRSFDDAQFERRRLEAITTEPERKAYVASPEDSILAKLEWYRLSDEVSERQWRDVLGVIRVVGDHGSE